MFNSQASERQPRGAPGAIGTGRQAEQPVPLGRKSSGRTALARPAGQLGSGTGLPAAVTWPDDVFHQRGQRDQVLPELGGVLGLRQGGNHGQLLVPLDVLLVEGPEVLPRNLRAWESGRRSSADPSRWIRARWAPPPRKSKGCGHCSSSKHQPVRDFRANIRLYETMPAVRGMLMGEDGCGHNAGVPGTTPG